MVVVDGDEEEDDDDDKEDLAADENVQDLILRGRPTPSTKIGGSGTEVAELLCLIRYVRE